MAFQEIIEELKELNAHQEASAESNINIDYNIEYLTDMFKDFLENIMSTFALGSGMVITNNYVDQSGDITTNTTTQNSLSTSSTSNSDQGFFMKNLSKGYRGGLEFQDTLKKPKKLVEQGLQSVGDKVGMVASPFVAFAAMFKGSQAELIDAVNDVADSIDELDENEAKRARRAEVELKRDAVSKTNTIRKPPVSIPMARGMKPAAAAGTNKTEVTIPEIAMGAAGGATLASLGTSALSFTSRMLLGLAARIPHPAIAIPLAALAGLYFLQEYMEGKNEEELQQFSADGGQSSIEDIASDANSIMGVFGQPIDEAQHKKMMIAQALVDEGKYETMEDAMLEASKIVRPEVASGRNKNILTDEQRAIKQRVNDQFAEDLREAQIADLDSKIEAVKAEPDTITSKNARGKAGRPRSNVESKNRRIAKLEEQKAELLGTPVESTPVQSAPAGPQQSSTQTRARTRRSQQTSSAQNAISATPPSSPMIMRDVPTYQLSGERTSIVEELNNKMEIEQRKNSNATRNSGNASVGIVSAPSSNTTVNNTTQYQGGQIVISDPTDKTQANYKR